MLTKLIFKPMRIIISLILELFKDREERVSDNWIRENTYMRGKNETMS